MGMCEEDGIQVPWLNRGGVPVPAGKLSFLIKSAVDQDVGIISF